MFIFTGAFYNLLALKVIWMGGNALTTLDAEVFSQNTALDDIILWGNEISTLPSSIFSQNTALERLNLWDNSVVTLPSGIFTQNTLLDDLDLSQNAIATLPDGLLSQNSALTELDFSDNPLTTISETIFDPDNHPSHLNRFTISSNVLDCSTLCWLYLAEQAGWITVYQPSSTTCAAPPTLAGRTWDTLTGGEICPQGMSRLISSYLI